MDLMTAFVVLRRRWLVFILCLAAGIAGGFELGHHGEKKYAATAQVLINVPATANIADQLAGTQLSSNLVATYASLVDSAAIQARVADELRAEGVTDQAGSLGAAVEPGTYLIDLRATSSVPSIAEQTANLGAAALVHTVADLEIGQPLPIQVKVVSPATLPGAPYAPKPTLDLVIGVLLGLLVAAGGVAVVEGLDRTVRVASQADVLVNAPLLGVVPKHKRRTVIVGGKGDGVDGEPYRSLRTAIRFLDLDKPIRTMLITSPTANDGKTATATNLAIALSLSGERVILVDADLRRPGLARALGIESSVGLTSLVLGTARPADVLQSYAQNLLVVASGPLPPNPSEILGSQLMNNILNDFGRMADIVIIDAPPVLPVADAVALSAQVDATVLVLRHSATRRSGVAATRRRLDAVGANVVGYVLNAVPRRETREYYLDERAGYYAAAPLSRDHSVPS
jgi:capsular exopolysaccharide synthesis family protein